MSTLLEFYDDHLRRYGADDARGLAWRDARSQQVRFRVLAEVADLSGASVLDEGCGVGDLYPFLTERFANVRYKGVDINAHMIEEARHKHPDADFEVADFNEYRSKPVDYALASGTFTFRIPNAQEVYFRQIEKLFALARKGIAFNMLDARAYPGDPTYITYTIPEVYDFCAQLTDKLVIRQDYSPEDFTFYLYR